ncbi:MAG: VWA domain-containing protein [Acidobacteriota bacterium]|nr:VWA domain-containing protein [Acidobacteriota bacterium]
MMLTLLCSLFFYQIDDLEAWDRQIQEEITVNYLTLDVMAVDAKGRPVTDLKAADFQVKDKGRKVKIDFFDTLDMRGSSKESGNASEDPDLHRDTAGKGVQQLILALDMEDVTNTQVTRTLKQLRDYIGSLDNSFQYRIHVYSMEHGTVTKGFMSQRKAVMIALDEFAERHFKTRIDSRRPARGEGNLLDDLEEEDDGPITPWKKGNMLPRGPVGLADLESAYRTCMVLYANNPAKKAMCINDNLNSFIRQQYHRTLRVLGELQDLTRKFEEQDGLKTMLLVSPGFSTTSMDAAYSLARHVMGQADKSLHSRTARLFNNENIQRDSRKLLHTCAVNRIVFHAFDIYNRMDLHKRASGSQFAGPIPQTIYRDFDNEISSGLLSLARDTGGSFTQAFNLQTPIGRVINGSAFYYQLGYTTPKGKKGAWRKLKVTCKRKGVKLIYRKGYYG